jgi:hypothetical protein
LKRRGWSYGREKLAPVRAIGRGGRFVAGEREESSCVVLLAACFWLLERRNLPAERLYETKEDHFDVQAFSLVIEDASLEAMN